MKGLNKFLKNKNTVTILGVLACLVILFVGYNARINQKTALVTVYYANQTIQPKTLITEEMVSRTQVPKSFILGKYFKNYDDIVGKYSNYNSMISEGSLFYYDLLVDESSLPDAVLYDVNEGERLVSFPVNMVTTYGNSMMPGNIVDVYVKLIDGNKVVYGEYFETPSFIYFSLPEAKYLLFSSMNYLREYNTNADIEIALVPNTAKFDAKEATATEVTSTYLYNYVLNGIKQIDSQKELYDALLNEMEQQELDRKAKATDNATNNSTTNGSQTTNNTTNQ